MAWTTSFNVSFSSVISLFMLWIVWSSAVTDSLNQTITQYMYGTHRHRCPTPLPHTLILGFDVTVSLFWNIQRTSFCMSMKDLPSAENIMRRSSLWICLSFTPVKNRSLGCFPATSSGLLFHLLLLPIPSVIKANERTAKVRQGLSRLCILAATPCWVATQFPWGHNGTSRLSSKPCYPPCLKSHNTLLHLWLSL